MYSQRGQQSRQMTPSRMATQRGTAFTPMRYDAGRAQPKPPQSQGTPYQAYQPKIQQTSSYQQSQSFQPGDSMPVPAAPQAKPFKSVVYGLDGTAMDPAQFYNQRDALIQLLNDDNARYQVQSGVGNQFGPPPRAPDIASLWGKAGNMVNDGWRNPLTGGFPMAGQQQMQPPDWMF